MTGELRGTCDDLRRFRRNVQIPMYTSTSSPDLPWLDLNAVSRPKNPYGVDFHGTRQWLHLDHLLHSQDLSQCTHLLKLRVDANVWSPLNATLFDHVQPGTIYARSDHSFYAEREAFYDVFHDFYHRIFSEFVMASKYKYFEIPEARRAKEPLKHDALGALWLKQPELMFHAGCAKWPGETTCRFGLMANEVVSPQNKSRTTPGTGRGWGNEKFLAVQILQRAQVAAYDLPVHGIFYGKQVRNPPSCRQGTATGSNAVTVRKLHPSKALREGKAESYSKESTAFRQGGLTHVCTLRDHDARMCMACHRPTIPTSAQPCVAHAVLPIGGVTIRRPA